MNKKDVGVLKGVNLLAIMRLVVDYVITMVMILGVLAVVLQKGVLKLLMKIFVGI